jgi:hypothetical protein
MALSRRAAVSLSRHHGRGSPRFHPGKSGLAASQRVQRGQTQSFSCISVTSNLIGDVSLTSNHRQQPKSQHLNDIQKMPFLSRASCRRHFTYVPLDEPSKSLLVKYTHTPQTSVSLQTLMRSGRGEYINKADIPEGDDDGAHTATHLVLAQVGGFLRRELPIRLAHRIKDLDTVPIFRNMKSVNIVKDFYKTSFLDMENFPTDISDPKVEEAFSKLMEDIYERHAGVLVTMARGRFRNLQGFIIGPLMFILHRFVAFLKRHVFPDVHKSFFT